DDVFDQIFGNGFGGNFRGSFRHGSHGGFGRETFRQRGADLNAEVTVTFDEAAFGGSKVIHLQEPETGGIQSLEVKIPAGIENGKTIRLKGKGMPGIRSEEHTSELQSRFDLVCRLLLETKKNKLNHHE